MKRVSRLLIVVVVVLGVVGLPFGPARAAGGKKKKTPVPSLHPEDFMNRCGRPFRINNTFFPLVPGTTYLYMPVDEEEFEANVVHVSYRTRSVAGVRCRVVIDVEWEGEHLTEFTEDWYAQDKHGNVWYFGEATWAFEYDADGNLIEVSTEGSWEAGVDGAEPGIIMLADPRPGDTYRQEYYEGEAEDMAKVLRLNASVKVAYGRFRKQCLVTEEWTPLEPGIFEYKYYAPGVGNVLVEEIAEEKRVELIIVIKPRRGRF